MTLGTGLQAALAATLVSVEARRALEEDPASLKGRYSLSDAEVRLLTSLNPNRLSITAHNVAGKRAEFLNKALPSTLELIGEVRPKVVAAFLRRSIPDVQPAEVNRLVAEARRFVAYLADREEGSDSNSVRDLARYELMQLELSCSGAASLAAEKAHSDAVTFAAEAQQERGLHALYFRTGEHVRVASFSSDVVRLYRRRAECEVDGSVYSQPIVVAVAKAHGRSWPHTYVIGSAVECMLGLCDGSRPFSEVRALLYDQLGLVGDRMISAARSLIDAGLFSISTSRRAA